MEWNLAVATGNKHKLAEIASLMETSLDCIWSPAQFPGYAEPVEDGSTFTENAVLKAGALSRHLRQNFAGHILFSDLRRRPLWVLADDSGLAVDFLNGKPGVHSARYAAEDPEASGNTPDEANMHKLLHTLDGVPEIQRGARFVCVLATIEMVSGSVHCFEGACEGTIAMSPSGDEGFGYDPIFIPAGYDQSMAQLGDRVKSTISHRAKAIALFRNYLRFRPI